jgi:hypothetical protein
VVRLTPKELLAFYSSHVSCKRVLVSNTVRWGNDDDKFRPEIETILVGSPLPFHTNTSREAFVRPITYNFFTQLFIALWMYRSHISIRSPSVVLLISTLLTMSVNACFVICADKSPPTLPTKPQDRIGIDHVIIAFAKANARDTFQSMLPMHTVFRAPLRESHDCCVRVGR